MPKLHDFITYCPNFLSLYLHIILTILLSTIAQSLSMNFPVNSSTTTLPPYHTTNDLSYLIAKILNPHSSSTSTQSITPYLTSIDDVPMLIPSLFLISSNLNLNLCSGELDNCSSTIRIKSPIDLTLNSFMVAKPKRNTNLAKG